MEPSIPSNSKKSKEAPEHRAERVTKTDVVYTKPTLGQRFKRTFVAEDASNAGQYVVADVVVPGIRDVIVDGLFAVIEGIFYGRGRPGSGPRVSRTNFGHVSYGGISTTKAAQMSPDPRGPASGPAMTQQQRSRHDFSTITLPTRVEMLEVLENMYLLFSRYDLVTVYDLYDLLGISPDPVDQKWGWTSLQGATVQRAPRGQGYYLELPAVEQIR